MVAWRPELVARRIMSWLSQAPLLAHEADMKFFRRFLRNLTRQVRYLRRTVDATREGLPRLQAIIALTSAALCMPGQARMLKGMTYRLMKSWSGRSSPMAGISAAIPAP